ncbi:MAG: hypothetical protein IJ733_02535 [Lachnospiraceae bacterium]|nr:hypothetical protein [Lachnospiraceae bacterium]
MKKQMEKSTPHTEKSKASKTFDMSSLKEEINRTRKTKKYRTRKRYLQTAVLILCTAITFFGILTTPVSDEDILKKELKKHAELLKETECTEISPENLSGSRIVSAAEKKETPGSGTASDSFPQPPEKKAGRNTRKSKKNTGKITVIGDSVFLGAALEFKKIQKSSVIDAKISRQVCQALNVAKKLRKQKKLGDTIIISLGTNGPFNIRTGEALINYFGTDRQIFWINAYSRKEEIPDSVNQNIQKLAEQYNNLTVIPWNKEGKKHTDWFYQDGTHLNERGQKGFAKFVNKYLSGL